MQVFVPFDAVDPKSRLAPVLSATERRTFARAMLDDVIDAITAVDAEPVVLTTAPLDIDTQTRVDERPLTAAVNAVMAQAPVAIVMADLPLVRPATIERLLDTPGDVVIAPGLGGGTNALVTRTDAYRVDYHNGSYRTHLAIANDHDIEPTELDSFRLALDVDEPADLTEVPLHSDGSATTWLTEAGFELVVGDRGLRAQRPDS